MRRRIDRFVEDALAAFAEWFSVSDWRGKERDCVNLFAQRFLASEVHPDAAISEQAQIRIESPVPQPAKFEKPSAPKDIVIWGDGIQTAWDRDWRAVNAPRVVMEWKVDRFGQKGRPFDEHDADWLCAFTREYSGTFGYLVTARYGVEANSVDWAKVAQGDVYGSNRRS